MLRIWRKPRVLGGKKALDEAGTSPKEVDLILVGTISGDVVFPATACFVQEKLGAVNAAAYDISVPSTRGCGFIPHQRD